MSTSTTRFGDAPELTEETYAWLEDQTDPLVIEWAANQQQRTERYLDNTGIRAAVSSQIEIAIDRERRGLPRSAGGRRFEQRKAVGEEQYSLWMSTGDDEIRLIDPADLDPSGLTALTVVRPSPDGTNVAWGSARSGSDWQTIRVRNCDSGEDLPDTLTWVKAAQAEWNTAGDGFYYLGFNPPRAGHELLNANDGQEIRFHRLGDPQSADTAVFNRPGAQWLTANTPHDSGLLLVEIIDGTTTVEIVAASQATPGEFATVVESSQGVVYIGYAAGSIFYVSYDDSVDGVVMRARVTSSGVTTERIELPEGFVDAYSSAVTENYLVVAYSSCSPHRLGYANLKDGSSGVIDVPKMLMVDAIEPVPHTDSIDVMLSGYMLGERLDRYSFASKTWSTLHDSTDQSSTNRVKRTVAVSQDGTEIPVIMIDRDGEDVFRPRPTLLVVYGGYGGDFLSYGFEDWHQVWIDAGGVIALGGLRGGSEFGDAWHQAAVREKKQNGFDDFIACAEHLISTGVTTPGQLGINGMSNGGLHVGAVITQRPELFGAAVAEVGVMDMLRFHLFTVGAGWIREFGDPDDPRDRERLRAYSPFHNLRDDVDYPPTLVVTGDHDDRVVPGPHSYRFIERLQNVAGDTENHLLRVQPDAGHAAGKGMRTRVAERSDITTFLMDRLGLTLALSNTTK